MAIFVIVFGVKNGPMKKMLIIKIIYDAFMTFSILSLTHQIKWDMFFCFFNGAGPSPMQMSEMSKHQQNLCIYQYDDTGRHRPLQITSLLW